MIAIKSVIITPCRAGKNIHFDFARLVAIALSLIVFGAQAEQQQGSATSQPLPSPLTLEFVLSQAIDRHPVIQSMQARVSLQEALQQQVESESGINVSLEAHARYIEPSHIAPDQDNNDSRLQLFVRKQLYDFGRSSAAESAAQAEVESSEWLLEQAKNNHLIDLMTAYFDVLLADLTYIRNNENLATSFLTYDRLRMRRDLGHRSDIEVAEAYKDYQTVRREYYKSRTMQQITRARLANLMNRPGELSAEVAEPDLDYIGEELASIETLTSRALDNNLALRALRKQVAAAEKRLKSARAGTWPILKGEVQVADYARDTGNSNDYEAAIILDVPLWTGGSVQANVARQRATLLDASAKLHNEEMNVRQAVLETWQTLDVLRIAREEADALVDYRDLYLDRSRALYELEVKTDLGDSMVAVSDARLKMAEARFKTALALARLNALIGKPVYPLSFPNKETTNEN